MREDGGTGGGGYWKCTDAHVEGGVGGAPGASLLRGLWGRDQLVSPALVVRLVSHRDSKWDTWWDRGRAHVSTYSFFYFFWI